MIAANAPTNSARKTAPIIGRAAETLERVAFLSGRVSRPGELSVPMGVQFEINVTFISSVTTSRSRGFSPL
jgi:hypothetical protein